MVYMLLQCPKIFQKKCFRNGTVSQSNNNSQKKNVDFFDL